MTHSGKTICIIPRKLGLGGPNTFQGVLMQALERRGVSVSHDPLEPGNSAILVIGGTRHVAELRRAQKAGVPVVQRLNGMNWVQRKKFTGIRHFLKAEVGNLTLRRIRRLADKVIYQSEFTRQWWERVNGELTKPQTVIHNGVDLNCFHPAELELPLDFYRVLLVEGHHGGGYEQGLLSAVELVRLLNRRMEKRVELAVVGDVPTRLRQQAEQLGGIIDWRGVVPHADIPALERTAHLLYATDINAACPNSVIEALACGLPVVAFATGAMPELVVNGSGLLADYGADEWKLEKPDIPALADSAREILLDQMRFRINAREHAITHFDIEQVTEKYLEVLLGG